MLTDFIEVIIITVTVTVVVKLMINFVFGFVLMSVRGTSPNLHFHSRFDNLLVMSACLHLPPLLSPIDLLGKDIDPGHVLLT